MSKKTNLAEVTGGEASADVKEMLRFMQEEARNREEKFAIAEAAREMARKEESERQKEKFAIAEAAREMDRKEDREGLRS